MKSIKNRFRFLRTSLWLTPIVWLLALAVGFASMVVYAKKAAPTENASQTWPAHSLLIKESTQPTLIVFLHPHCSCSRATLAELEKLLPRMIGKVQIILSYYQPSNFPQSWVHSDLWEKALHWPGVSLIADKDGQEADVFKAKASGEAFFYGANGVLLFHGGLTPSRGHMGESAGRQAILDWLDGLDIKVQSAKVFGCQIKKNVASGDSRAW